MDPNMEGFGTTAHDLVWAYSYQSDALKSSFKLKDTSVTSIYPDSVAVKQIKFLSNHNI